MSKAKDQYYAHIWKQVIQHLKNSGNIEEYVVDSFFAPCYIYELNDVKVMVVTDDIIKKQVIIGENSFSVNNLDLLSSAFIEVLDLDSPITVEVYTQNEIKQFEDRRSLRPGKAAVQTTDIVRCHAGLPVSRAG